MTSDDLGSNPVSAPIYPAAPPALDGAAPSWHGWPQAPDDATTAAATTPASATLPAAAPRSGRRAAGVALFATVLIIGAASVAVGALLPRTTPSVATSSLTSKTPTTSRLPTVPTTRQTPTTTATSGPTRAAQIAASVDPAIADINTRLSNGANAAGTGMVLSSDGLVLTNNHVIADATTITAQLDGTGPTYQADVVGYDTTADVAVLQLRGASGLPTISTADSSKVKPAESVVAIGNALGQGGAPAVAAGTVTRLEQSITVSDENGQNQETLHGLIEINAALQPGDSGGPLVNSDAKVIGMDTAASVSGRRQRSNDGYAIPINDALGIADQIAAGTSSPQIHIGDRALLGVEIDPATTAQVAAVQPAGPAANAGIVTGDTIVTVDNTPVTDGASVRTALDSFHPGDHTTITWVDGAGNIHHASVTLAKGPPA